MTIVAGNFPHSGVKMQDQETQEEEFLPDEHPKSRSQMRGWWFKTIALLALVVLSVVLLFTLGGYLTEEGTAQLSFGALLSQSISYPKFILLIGVLLLYMAIESGKYASMLKVFTGKFHFRTSIKTMFLGKYYDGITPLATGGQPAQIVYLHKKASIPRGVATAVPVMRYLVSIIVLTILSAVLLVLAPNYVTDERVGFNQAMRILAWISLFLNFSLPLVIILFSVFPKRSKRILAAIIKFLTKLHIVKHPFRATMRILQELNEYGGILKEFFRKFLHFIPFLILCILESLLFVTIPFFVVIAIAGQSVQPSWELLMQISCLVIVSRYVSLLIPTPGNTGAAEAASTLVFVMIPGIDTVIGWVVLVWRIATYYIYILSGIGINIFEIIRGAVRNRRQNKQTR